MTNVKAIPRAAHERQMPWPPTFERSFVPRTVRHGRRVVWFLDGHTVRPKLR